MGKLFIFTGSGISVDSGIPTYRTKDSLWDKYDVEKVCTYSTWENNMQEVYDFYNQRRAELFAIENGKRIIKDNKAHQAVAKWIKQYGGILITQNVDDLHEQAGSTNVIHLHGRLQDMKCTECFRVWDGKQDEFVVNQTECHYCGSHKVKPGTIFFGEAAPEYSKLHKAISKIQEDDVVIIIGTTGEVVPIDIFLSESPGYKILNNLEANQYGEAMNGVNIWDSIIYKSSTEAVDEIEHIIKERLG